MSRGRESQRAKERTRRRAERANILPMKREDGTLDLTPHIASMDIVTGGKYLDIGKGYIVPWKAVKQLGLLNTQGEVGEEAKE